MQDSDRARRQELSQAAYFAILKAMMLNGRNDTGLLAKLRSEFGISNDIHRAYLSDLMKSKGEPLSTSPPALPPILVPAHGHQGVAAGMQQMAGLSSTYTASTRPQAVAAQPPNQRKRPIVPDDNSNLREEKRTKMASSSFPRPSMNGLNADFIGAKVNRWWAQSAAWYNGVITDFKPSKQQYCVTYDLGTNKESGELLNIDIALTSGELQMLKDRVDLANFPHSRAVQSSSVLIGWRNEHKRQQGLEGGSSGVALGNTVRKRNVVMLDSDDE